MPLTTFQKRLAQLLAKNRTDDSHLAGGAAILRAPNTQRFSNDLDYFHDSSERVATAFDADADTLLGAGYTVDVVMRQPGFVRAVATLGKDATKIEWAHDSAWRFMPVVHDDEVGTVLDPIDLATNKLLALVGRNAPRDFLDIVFLNDTVLPLGALCWAAAGKDPGFTPHALLSLLRRRGKYQQADFARLALVAPVDLVALKIRWLEMLELAEAFIDSRPSDEMGCLYIADGAFVAPAPGDRVICHFGRPGGVVPKIS